MPVNNSLGETPDFASPDRQRTFRILIYIIAASFILRLGQLQLLEGSEYLEASAAQAIKRVRIEPFRGNMYDRNGTLIVHNESSFTVTLTPNDFRSEAMPLLSSILGMDSSEINAIVDKFIVYSKFNPIKIYRDADFKIVSSIEEYTDYLPGIDVAIEPKRLYSFEGHLAHLLGYTREISRAQLDKYKFYQPGDIIGQNGIESGYESFLRGRDGIQFVAVNKFGQNVASFQGGKRDIPANNGFDLYLSIDIKMQELAEKLLAGRRGAVVAMDPHTGEILTLASKPDYDPRDFSGRVPSELYRELSADPASPLLHRAIMSQYPPGSTWKMLMGIAGLAEGIIDENTTFPCVGGFQIGNKFIKCHGHHGNINLRRAIENSCNAYFNQLAIKMGQDIFDKYVKMFGFGERTGVDLPNEKRGLMPTREWLTKRLGPGGVTKGRLANYGIGQGEILVTPLQMAVYVSTIANRGTLLQPHVVKAIENNLTHKKEPLSFGERKLPVPQRAFEAVAGGMFDVVQGGGTGTGVRIPGINVCGKTGTAQNPHGEDHSWFVCFAPAENPKIAIVVFVENAGFGAAVAGPIAKAMLNQFFFPDSVNKDLPILVKKDSSDVKPDSGKRNTPPAKPLADANQKAAVQQNKTKIPPAKQNAALKPAPKAGKARAESQPAKRLNRNG
ncbi:MAG: penicillin-binding protein 2 [Chloroflexota bacterium]